jgi:DNA topoisomerase I
MRCRCYCGASTVDTRDTDIDSDAHAKKDVVRAIESIAAPLGNTAVLLPELLCPSGGDPPHLNGSLVETLKARAQSELTSSLRGVLRRGGP